MLVVRRSRVEPLEALGAWLGERLHLLAPGERLEL
jgi:hypothetical protein